MPGVQGRWKDAFPRAEVMPDFNAVVRLAAPDALVWVDASNIDELKRLRRERPELALVALSNAPNAEQGLACFEVGVRGYCHALAAPQQLKQIQVVIANGGLWLGTELMRRATAAVGRHMASSVASEEDEQARDNLELLTPRQREVARQVIGGASNKDVARRLDITLRTVKAHMTAIFEKFGVRDRLQLVIQIRGGRPPEE